MLSENYLKTFPPLPASQHFLFSLLTRLYVNVEQVAAITIDEAFAYVRKWHPDLRISSVESMGLITLVSGTPLN